MKFGVSAAVFLAASTAMTAGVASPARAATNPTVCRTFAGSFADRTELYGCATANVYHDSGVTHVQLTSNVSVGPNFGTAANGCASTVWGQFQNAAGTVWDIPQVGKDCTRVLYTGTHSSGVLVHLDSDTSAVRVKLNFCLYWYYPSGSTNTMCTANTAWSNFP